MYMKPVEGSYLDVKGRQAASCIWDITVHWHCFGSDWCHFLYF